MPSAADTLIARLQADCTAAEAVERQLTALFREIGWIQDGLAGLGENAKPLLDCPRPIAEAAHG
jgi:hypothetical protein